MVVILHWRRHMPYRVSSREQISRLQAEATLFRWAQRFRSLALPQEKYIRAQISTGDVLRRTQNKAFQALSTSDRTARRDGLGTSSRWAATIQITTPSWWVRVART